MTRPLPLRLRRATAPAGLDLRRRRDALLDAARELGMRWVCLTAGSPYYNPHIQRPALFPPSDGYLPPEDPLVGVARQIAGDRGAQGAASRTSRSSARPTRYLQEWLPNVGAARSCATGWRDFDRPGPHGPVATPSCRPTCSPARPLERKLFCRTFSDCTTAPRNGLVSGCYPLDPFYTARPEADTTEGRSRPTANPRRPFIVDRWSVTRAMNTSRAQTHVAVTAFLALFAIVGVALYGLPFFYDHMVREFGWTRPAGDVGQRIQQATGRPVIRVHRRAGWWIGLGRGA